MSVVTSQSSSDTDSSCRGNSKNSCRQLDSANHVIKTKFVWVFPGMIGLYLVYNYGRLSWGKITNNHDDRYRGGSAGRPAGGICTGGTLEDQGGGLPDPQPQV